MNLLSCLSRRAWQSLKLFLRKVAPEMNPIPGAVIAVQPLGDLPGFNPPLHPLALDYDNLLKGDAKGLLKTSASFSDRISRMRRARLTTYFWSQESRIL